jgi:hypothetical protein
MFPGRWLEQPRRYSDLAGYGPGAILTTVTHECVVTHECTAKAPSGQGLAGSGLTADRMTLPVSAVAYGGCVYTAVATRRLTRRLTKTAGAFPLCPRLLIASKAENPHEGAEPP